MSHEQFNSTETVIDSDINTSEGEAQAAEEVADALRERTDEISDDIEMIAVLSDS